MRTRNLTSFLFGAKVTSRRPPQPEMTFIVRGSFRLHAGGAVKPFEGLAGGLLEQGPLTAEVYAEEDEDRLGACLYPGDFADFKPRAEVFLLGCCRPPPGKPVSESGVRFGVGAWSKSLRVVGDRTWGIVGSSAPRPFDRMPLDWAHAFGGPGYDRNPCGRGFGTPDVPNVEAPGAAPRNKGDRIEPAGFGPINPAWPQRAGKMGTRYGDASYRARAPFYAEDFDWTHFLGAAPDQWLEGYLRGDEAVVLQNVHPSAPVFSTRLPALRVRAFSKNATGAVGEARMNLDTLLVDAEKDKLVLTWRGHLPCREIDLSDVQTVLVASESLADPPLPADHYAGLLEAFHADPIGVLAEEKMPGARAQMAALQAATKDLPCDPDVSPTELALGIFGNDDLMTLGVGEADRPDALARAASAAARVKDAASKVDAARAEAQAKLPPGAELPPAKQPPKTPDQIAEEAPDVRGQVTQAVTDAVKKARVQVEKAAGSPDALPPELAKQLADLEKLDDALREPEMQKKLAMATLPRAAELGPGRDLSHRNLTGRDLSGLDLSGSNFEGALLGGARLAGARLRGANLRQALLQGADLAGADLSDADLTRALLNGAKAAGAIFDRVILEQTLLAKATLTQARFEKAKGQMILLSGADLRGARFAGASFSKVMAEGARLEGADFGGATLVKSGFVRCKAEGARFRRAVLDNATFLECDLRKADFVEASGDATSFMHADLTEADFRRAVFPGAHFMNATARAARFFGADLRGSEMIRALLDRADFERANLFGANLGGASLNATRFVRASLYRARLAGARGDHTDFDGANTKDAVLPS